MAAIQFDNIDANCTIESFTATVRVTFQVRKGTKFSATLSLHDALPDLWKSDSGRSCPTVGDAREGRSTG